MLDVLRQRSARLSWQLWASHFTVIVITLVALVGSIVTVTSIWLLRQAFILREPALDAQVVSIAVGNLVRRGVPDTTISGILAEMRNGGVRMPIGPFETERGPRWGGSGGFPRPDLQNLDYVIVLTPDGRVLASSDRNRFPLGSGFAPASDSGLAEIVSRASAG